VWLGRVALACETDGLTPGTAVTLAIRPEDIVIETARGGELNAVPARVEALAFLGSFFRADLVGDGMEGVLFRADLPVDLVRRLGIAEKSRVSMLLSRERIRIYPGSTVHR
jgi:iron(III) transport system ATP-binding protein